jgi:uncharacterized tellurite resistance protein B-like protein
VLWFRPQINGDGVVVLAEWEAAKGLGESQTHVAIHPDNIDALITILQRAKVQAAKYQAQVKIKEKASR